MAKGQLGRKKAKKERAEKRDDFMALLASSGIDPTEPILCAEGDSPKGITKRFLHTHCFHCTKLYMKGMDEHVASKHSKHLVCPRCLQVVRTVYFHLLEVPPMWFAKFTDGTDSNSDASDSD